MADVGHFVGGDQMVLGVDRDLDVVADHPRALAVGRHGPAVRIGQRDLLVGRGMHFRLQGLERAHLLAQGCDLLRQPHGLGLGQLALLPVGRLQGRHVPLDAGLDLLHPPLDRGAGEVLVAGVHRLELASIDRRHGLREQPYLAAELHELAARRPDRQAVVPAEVRDRLEVRRQPSREPHQFDVPLRLPLQPPAGGDLVQIAVDVDLQQQRRMVARTTRRRRNHPIEPERPKVQLVDEHLDRPDRILLGDPVVQVLRKQHALTAILTLDEALHRLPL